MSESENNSNNSSGFNLVLFILNIVVIANSKREIYQDLGTESYYNFILCMLIISCLGLGFNILTCFGVCLSLGVNREKAKSSGCLIVVPVLLVLLVVGVILAIYYFMGVIWDEHPTYSVLFYKQYWSELLTKFSRLPTGVKVEKRWAYSMAEILVRIYSFIMIMFTIFIAPVLACLGVVAVCNKKSDNSNSVFAGNTAGTL